ncbi:MAG TPA: PQQ-dependent sugar dehydrogenase [Candidatus Saccharimonadales bacterium]|nr:PQQ-dependent sugar dehydrogenase [Candidatus Saccharimonadales bacterium]
MSDNNQRLRWLIVVVVVELLFIIGLVVWAIVRPPAKTDTSTTSTIGTQTGPITTSLVATGLSAPTDIAAPPIKGDDRLFVTERVGTIKMLSKKDEQKVTPFLDISSKVHDNKGEMGLLGMTFHPNFAQNGFFFINYVDKDLNTTIARFTVNTDGVADPASEKLIFKVKQPYANHNAGALAFGPDGMLYIPLGDGGSGGDPENRAQNKGEFLGKILRVDVDTGDPYTVPTTNPFVTDTSFKPETWAWGLRNPWRISFDKKSNDLYIADVGQGKIEEVNIQKAASKGGENYGWRCYEGSQTFNTTNCPDVSTITMPVFEYNHSEGRCSITGGYVYRGSKIIRLDGSYIYGDLCSGEIFSASQADGKWTQATIVKTPFSISTFGQDFEGEVYVADLNTGSIYELATR